MDIKSRTNANQKPAAGAKNSPAEFIAHEQKPALDEVSETSPETEIGGPKGLDPTRYGDWERKGRCIDF